MNPVSQDIKPYFLTLKNKSAAILLGFEGLLEGRQTIIYTKSTALERLVINKLGWGGGGGLNRFYTNKTLTRTLLWFIITYRVFVPSEYHVTHHWIITANILIRMYSTETEYYEHSAATLE